MKKGLLSLFFVTCFFAVFSHASAATLYMDPRESELKRGDTMVLSVRLDTDAEECVNAVDVVIKYSENIQLIDTSRGNSIMSLWVENPTIDKANRTVSFAAGIPNGYCGRIAGDPRLTNNVIDLLFQSPGLQIGTSESGNLASIDFSEETNVLLNDGFGTMVAPQRFGATILLAKEVGSSVQNPWQLRVNEDDIPPEKFSIALERTENAFSNRYFITFNTTDKQSGIDHYEVIEEPLSSKNFFGWGAATAPWKVETSPYILDDQSLNSTIRVRAIDKAGNEYIATYVPEEGIRTISQDNMFLILGGVAAFVLLLAIGVVVFLLYKRRKGSIADVEKEVEE